MLSKVPQYICPELFSALKSAAESSKYLSDSSVRHIFLETVMSLIKGGITYGYQILSVCLDQIYEDLEPYMETLIDGIGRTNGRRNQVDEGDRPERLEILSDFWVDFCNFELCRQFALDEFSEFDISAPEQNLRLLQLHGDRIVVELSKYTLSQVCEVNFIAF